MRNFIYLTLLLFLASACATIISGTTQEVTFDSEPQGVQVTVNAKVLGKTPFAVQLDKKADQTVEFYLDGYKRQTRQLTTRMEGWFWGNIVIGGLFGSTTDGATGSIHEYSPNQYYVTMVAGSSSSVMAIKPEKAKVKEFIVANYDKVITDLAKGEGEYLDSLLAILKVQDSNRSDSINKIKSLSENHTNIPEFAEQVAVSFSN